MLLKDCFTAPTVRTVFLAHVAPTARSAQYTKNTLDYASQMVAIAEKKKATVHGITPCDRWSKSKFASLTYVDRNQSSVASTPAPQETLDYTHTLLLTKSTRINVVYVE